MSERRRYTRRQKAEAVVAAMASSVTAAAEAKGIPATTIDYWVHHPEFVELRAKTSAHLAEEMRLLAHLSARALAQKVLAGEVDARDLTILLGVSTEKSQLLAGHATARTETKELTDGLDDHERQALRDVIDRALTESAEAGAGGDPVGVGAEVRE